MHQILLKIPLKFFDWLPDWWPEYLPVHGYGFMLLLAFISSLWLAARRAEKEGIARERIHDLALWLFIPGILGARIVYTIQYGLPLNQFFFLWNGGLVFYGSALGGLAGFLLAYYFVIRQHGLSPWKLADVIAPSVALGLCLGRIGCYLNGCCYGNVACTHCPAVHFPLSSPPRFTLVERGLQTAAGFTVREMPNPVVVEAVEPGSPAAASGLQAGDVIARADGQPIGSYPDLFNHLVADWPRGKSDLALTVVRSETTVALPPFTPWTLGLHPTQLYESVSTLLLLLLLSAYFPFRRHDGEVMVLFMIGYSIHRFLNEMLRKDTDPVAFGMTLSQNGSILVLVAAAAFFLWLRRQPQTDRG